MLIQNAIDFIINSKQFVDKIHELGINTDTCRRIDTKLLADNEREIFYYEVYFDFGNAGPSINDINARIQINSDGSFSFLYFQ